MVLPSRRTLLLAFGATLLIIIPGVRIGGEQSYCEALRNAHRDEHVVVKPNEVAFDPCIMTDFGMTDAVRWSVESGVILLIVAAWSYIRDLRRAKRQ